MQLKGKTMSETEHVRDYEMTLEPLTKTKEKKKPMKQNLVTLQLTVPALEKLFEGDPEVIVGIRQAAIAEFGRRKMGDLLTKAAKADIDHAIAQQVGSIGGTSYAPKITLQEPILQMIREETRMTMDVNKLMIDQTIQELAQKIMDDQVQEIDQKVKREVERRVNNEVASRVTAEVKAKMTEIMKIMKITQV
jgi:hypothetical protein